MLKTHTKKIVVVSFEIIPSAMKTVDGLYTFVIGITVFSGVHISIKPLLNSTGLAYVFLLKVHKCM
jgi:hypothetical protein